MKSQDPRVARGAMMTLAALVALVAPPPPAAAQEGVPVNATVWGAFSWRDGADGIRIAEDLRSLALRLALRRDGLRPWLQVDGYERPGLECVEIPGIECNPDGWIARAGVTLPLSEDETRPGLHPHLAAGIGAAFSDETEASYLLGLGISWTLVPAVAPRFELRYEQVPGLRAVVMTAVGLRFGLP